MIVCPNCNHTNPEGAVQCEACIAPLPATTDCPSCGATVQADAAFCGQCGYNLRAAVPTAVAATVAPDIPVEVPPLIVPDPPIQLQPVTASPTGNYNSSEAVPPTAVAIPTPLPVEAPPPTVASFPPIAPPESNNVPPTMAAQLETEPEPIPAPPPQPEPEMQPAPAPQTATPGGGNQSRTQLQQVTARLVHIQSDTPIELPQSLSVIHIGKANDRIPPDIDVSGFKNSEVVSRVHADIRVEGDGAYYIEDVGSSNGTYVNGMSMPPGNRHRLRPGDRIGLGKGDLVTFLFQLS